LPHTLLGALLPLVAVLVGGIAMALRRRRRRRYAQTYPQP
jgi:cytochrome c-type biogenesis protein CcmH/NrfF